MRKRSTMKRILVVDDQQDIRELVRMTLEIDGHEVHEAINGHAALQLAGQLAPDLMLLDVMMSGGIDGLDVCRRIKQQGGAGTPPHMKVVMLSALGMKAEQRTGLAAGADGYLTKPFSPRELLAVVARMA